MKGTILPMASPCPIWRHETVAAAPCRILIVDDHPVFSRGLSHLLESDPNLRVSGIASDARVALDRIGREPIDVVTVDISLGGGSGLDLIKTLARDYPEIRLIVISMHDEVTYGERALRAGAAGYVTKSASGETLLAAVRGVVAGQISVSDALATRMLRRVARGRDGSGTPFDLLSDREIEIFCQIGGGQTSEQIARVLHISKKTVESHRFNIRNKLELGSGLELVRYAMDWTHRHAG